MSSTVPLKIPDVPIKPYADTALAGPLVLPLKRLMLFSSEEWEYVVLEWAHYLRSLYELVEKCGGAGDMGRDVIGFPKKDCLDVWDNYQCKHYDHPLRPSDIWIELGKLVYYTYHKKFKYPRKYVFVSPQGAGTTLAKLLKEPDELRRQLIENWYKYCRDEITKTAVVDLDNGLRSYLDGLDFTVFTYLTPHHLIDGHRETPYYVARFGGGLPPRPETPTPPDLPTASEMTYLRKLFDAYGDFLKCKVSGPDDLKNEQNLKGHYGDSRIEFYSAETLRSFSRDTLPEGVYEDLQEEVHDGIRDALRGDYEDGYKCILAVVKEARQLQLTSNALLPRLEMRDRGGICHQLANEKDNVRWVR